MFHRLRIIQSPTEQMTAATDVLIAGAAIACATGVRGLRARAPWKAAIWTAAYGTVATGATLGAIAHGFEMSKATNTRIWQPLNLALSTTVALFVVGTVYDTWGEATARRALLPALAVGGAFWKTIPVGQTEFWPFLIYQAAGMLLALGSYGRLALRGTPGAAWMVTGILLSMAAAGIQADGRAALKVGVELDANSVYHLVQLAGILALYMGIRESLLTEASPEG
ncbi:MAG: hypothetical protein HC876_00770 [Chloroflexaceae bacterium]|nr:hypothetical protein [Chloroflexaceae bacterium]